MMDQEGLTTQETKDNQGKDVDIKKKTTRVRTTKKWGSVVAERKSSRLS